MAFKYLTPEGYKSRRGEFSYPSHDINPLFKCEKDYFLAFNNAFFSDYASNYCYVPFEFGAKRSFQEMRAYATGQQSSNKIKENLIGAKKKNTDGKFITKMNVSFDTYYKLPQMFDVMREKNMTQEYDVAVTCIDDDSIAAKEADKAMLEFLVDANNKNFMKQVGFIPNTPLNPEEMGLRTVLDVKTYFEIGGYTMHREIACQAACQKTKLVSNYKVLQDSTFDDLIITGLCGWKTYIESSTMLPKIRRVNLDRALIPYSEHNDFNDITRAGEIRLMTIADVRKENPNLTSTDLKYLAKCFAWMNSEYTAAINGAYMRTNLNPNYISDIDVDPISRVKIMVLDSQWLSTDIESHIKNSTKSGQVRFKEVPYDYKVDKKAEKDGVKKIQKNVIRKYHSSWIIGTDMFLDYGICKDVVYYGKDGNKTPKLDFFFAKTGNASLVERAIAIVDDIDMAIVKQRNALATIPAAPGLAIQKDLLENVFLNGILQQPDDIMQALQERGVLYYNALDDHGKPLYMSGGQKPIEYLDVTKIAGILAVYGNHIAEKVNELREVLGMQNGSDAGGTSAYQGLGQTKLAFQAANASLYPTFNAFNYVFKAAFDDIIKKWQIVAKNKKGDVKVSYAVLGSKNMAVFKLGKDFDNWDFNLEIDIAPSQEERQNLLQSITQQKALGDQTGGAKGLTMSEYLYAYRKIMAGNIDEAMYVLSQVEAKKQQAEQQSKQADIQANATVQQQSAQMKGQLDQQAIQAKGQATNENSLLTALLKQNEMLLQALVAPTKPEEQSNIGIAPDVIASNNQQVQQILAPQPSPEEMAMQQAQMQEQMPQMQ